MAVRKATRREAGFKNWVGGAYASAQTNVSLLAAPGERKAIMIDAIHCSAAAACAIQLLDGSGGTTEWRVDLGAQGHFTAMPLAWPKGLSENTALCLTTSLAGNHAVYVLCHIESW